MQIKIALAQIPVSDDIRENLKLIKECIDYAGQQRADILLTPEGSLSGYTPRFDAQLLETVLEEITRYARGKAVGLALGTCREECGARYNQLRFYDARGEFLGAHTKTLLCGSMTVQPHGEINDYAVRPLSTYDFMGARISGLICNDLWANPMCTPQDDPHLTHKLAKLGAKVIFHAVNGGRADTEFSGRVCRNFHESNLIMRAACDGLFIATVDNSYPHSIGVSSLGGIIAPSGEWLFKLPDRGMQLGCAAIEIKL